MGMFFYNPADLCPEKPRKFMWFKWYDYHSCRVVRIKPWAFGKWEAFVKCPRCGATWTKWPLSDSELLMSKLPLDEIKEQCKNRGWWTNQEGGDHETN